jgi:YVTN family beta-propeller protein
LKVRVFSQQAVIWYGDGGWMFTPHTRFGSAAFHVPSKQPEEKLAGNSSPHERYRRARMRRKRVMKDILWQFVEREYCLKSHLVIGVALILNLLGIGATAQTAYVTNFEDNTVSVIDTGNHRLLATISGFTSPLGLAMTPDGSKVYVANGTTPGTVSVINTFTNRIATTITVGGDPGMVAVSPDGNHVYVTNQSDGTLSVINTSTNNVSATVTLGGSPAGVAVTPDNAHVYIAVFPSRVAELNASTNQVTATISDPSINGAALLAITPDGKTLYVSNEISNKISVVSTATNLVTTSISVGQIPLGLAITPDGKTLYVANGADSTVSVIATATNTVSATISGFNGPEGLAVTADGKKAYAANTVANTLSEITTASNTITATVATGMTPVFVTLSGNRQCLLFLCF